MSDKIAGVVDISTTPEFEILFILNENLYNEFLKVKSSTKPCSFYMKHNKKYRKQFDFVLDYFSKMTNKEIINLINLYVKKHGKTTKNNQKTLKEIINDSL